VNPFEQFGRWFEEAGRDERMALATASRDGRPSLRMVLLKEFDELGFVFFTGYESRKGRELAENPFGALLFHWPGRQVRVEGRIERVSPEESDSYWATRPPASRRSAAASRQSEPIASREVLEERVAATGDDPPRPAHWGGYRLVPDAFEFWEHRDDRLHDRHRWTLADSQAADCNLGSAAEWRVERLQP
jgi:pyridoxamine 5'-phosphate oxidase